MSESLKKDGYHMVHVARRCLCHGKAIGHSLGTVHYHKSEERRWAENSSPEEAESTELGALRADSSYTWWRFLLALYSRRRLLFAVFCLFCVGVGLWLGSPSAQQLVWPMRYQDDLVSFSHDVGVDPCLVAALICSESHFRPESTSDAGAIGLMQLMPETAQWVAHLHGVHYGSVQDLYQPELNLRLGIWYLAWLLEIYEGDQGLAIAAYNVGPGMVEYWLCENQGEMKAEDIPYAETRHYVRKVLNLRERYAGIYPELAR